MKNKLSRIVGVAVSVALVASLCVFAIPAATPAEAAPGNQQWAAQTLPGTTGNVLRSGTNVTDYAVASDGLTIYVANNGVASNAAGAVLKSTNGGQSFTALGAISAAVGNVMSAIAVAPDDANVVAVVEYDATTAGACIVWITKNGGTTWTALPAYTAPLAGTSDITDIDVGPARSGTALGREYVIALADNTTTVVAGGDVQIIGDTLAWTTVSATDVATPTDVTTKFDYMAVKFSPAFVGDRTVACVGANTTGGVYFQLVNTNTNFQTRAPVLLTPTAVAATTIDYDSPAGVAASSIVSADIALPTDFDPNVVSLRSAFAGFGSITPFTDNDVYRIDDGTKRNLDAVSALAIKSVAYTGVIDEGTLFIGESATNNVKYALDPWVSLPTWKSTRKGPSPDATISANAMPVVRVSPTDSNVVFAGTTSGANLESAFSVSNNKGLSFDAESLIDSTGLNIVVTVDDIYITPDGGTIFMATDDGAQLSLWKSALPTSATSWSRVYVDTAVGPGLVRLNPDWDTTPAVYFADCDPAGAGAIFVSTDGGDIFATGRTAPTGITATDIVVENANTIYLASGANVYKSTNSAAIWATPVSGQANAIRTLAMAPSYPALPEEGHLLVGGTAACSYSTNGGTSFTQIAGGLAGTGVLQILAHEDYATAGANGENMIYCADSTVGMNVFRFVIGTSTAWEDMVATVAAGNVSGLAISDGVLYALQDGALGAYRTLSPTVAVGLMTWEAANIGAAGTLDQAPSALRVKAGSNVLYAIDTTGAAGTDIVLAYTDMLATAVTTLTAPADGALVNVDPVSGRADDIQFAWSSMGSGTGLVDDFQIQIAVAGTGFAAPLTQRYFTGVVAAGFTTGLNAGNPQLSVGTTAQWVQNLTSNTNYEWRIRARDQINGDGIMSGWSEAGSFSILAGGEVEQPHAGPMLLGPVGGAVDVSLTPGFSWAPIARTTEYEFILATDAGLVNTLADTPVTVTSPAFQVTEALDYGTVYFWAVKSITPTASPQAIGSFTTMEEPAAAVYTCAYCGLQFDSQEALEAHIAEVHAPVTAPTPVYMWAIIAIGAVLVIVVIVLIARTRRVV